MYPGEKSQPVRVSKSHLYEIPCCVTGASKLAGLKQEPKGICIDRTIGTRKGTDISERNAVVEE